LKTKIDYQRLFQSCFQLILIVFSSVITQNTDIMYFDINLKKIYGSIDEDIY
jgi:hypothetical protein